METQLEKFEAERDSAVERYGFTCTCIDTLFRSSLCMMPEMDAAARAAMTQHVKAAKDAAFKHMTDWFECLKLWYDMPEASL